MIQRFKEVVTSVDVLNTINGGLSEPFLSMREGSEGREVRVRIPGVDRQAVQVEVRNNKLSIFYYIPVNSDGQIIQMPQVVYNRVIPYFIQAEKISATYEDREVVVKLPFNERSGNNRKIEVGEE